MVYLRKRRNMIVTKMHDDDRKTSLYCQENMSSAHPFLQWVDCLLGAVDGVDVVGAGVIKHCVPVWQHLDSTWANIEHAHRLCDEQSDHHRHTTFHHGSDVLQQSAGAEHTTTQNQTADTQLWLLSNWSLILTHTILCKGCRPYEESRDVFKNNSMKSLYLWLNFTHCSANRRKQTKQTSS